VESIGIATRQTERQPGTERLAPETLAAKGRSYFLQSCAHCHWPACGLGEDAPSLLKLQISGAHMALVFQSGIKGGDAVITKKYNEQDVAALVAYLKTLQ